MYSFISADVAKFLGLKYGAHNNESYNSQYSHERITNLTNYQGIFQTGVSYEKFDFVYNTGDGLFYYATEDMEYGGGAILSGSHRFTLDPDGPTVNGRPSHYILDDYNETDALGNTLQIGQTINLEGSIQDASGLYNVIDVQKNFLSSVDFSSTSTIEDTLDATARSSFRRKNRYMSSWFMSANKGESIEISSRFFTMPGSSNGWIRHSLWGWIYIMPLKENGYYGKRFWFWKNADNNNRDSSIGNGNGVWLYADESKIGNNNPASNAFLRVDASYFYKVSSGSDLYDINTSQGSVFLKGVDGVTNLRQDQEEFINDWQNLQITRDEYNLLPEYGSHRFRGGYLIYYLGQDDFDQNVSFDLLGDDGWLFCYKPLNGDNYRVTAGFYNYSNQKHYILRSNYLIEQTSNFQYTPKTLPNFDEVNRIGDGKFDRIQLQGINEETSIDTFENADSHVITLTAINEDPNGSDSWVTDRFFFDADYGSTVNFQAKNRRMEYDNGYYKLFPVSVNSLKFQANLKFTNRTNKEANAIIHFVENHLGQLEKDKNASYLKYSQGISGFRWDGNATFHPYDSIDNQSKTFYCGQFNHSLNFEDSNDINLTLTNLNTSILNKGESLYVKSAPSYTGNYTYEKNDVVYSELNNQYYYWYNETGAANKTPSIKNSEWTRASGLYSDINTEYWTREFFWLPSLGLEVNQQPRLNDIALSSKYSQIYNDGINESLLKLNLKFNNRSDDEAYAILHFLENHLGYIPFLFSPPAPYETAQNFVCQRWTHTYKYKDSHDIQATFEQYPFNFDAQEFSNFSTQPIIGPGELHFTNPLVFKTKLGDDEININKRLRKRMYLKNVGGLDVNISSITLGSENSGSFSILGHTSNQVRMIVPTRLNKSDYTYTLPSTTFISLPLGLNSKQIRLENYEDGIEGGQYFTVVDNDGNELEEYFQKNNGDIKRLSPNATNYSACSYFVAWNFFLNRSSAVLSPDEEGYLDVIYEPASLDIEDLLVDSNDNPILCRRKSASATSMASYGESHWTDYGQGEGRFMPKNDQGANNYEGYVLYHRDLFKHYYYYLEPSADEYTKMVLSKQNGYIEQEITIESDTFLSPQVGKLQIYVDINE